MYFGKVPVCLCQIIRYILYIKNQCNSKINLVTYSCIGLFLGMFFYINLLIRRNIGTKHIRIVIIHMKTVIFLISTPNRNSGICRKWTWQFRKLVSLRIFCNFHNLRTGNYFIQYHFKIFFCNIWKSNRPKEFVHFAVLLSPYITTFYHIIWRMEISFCNIKLYFFSDSPEWKSRTTGHFGSSVCKTTIPSAWLLIFTTVPTG